MTFIVALHLCNPFDEVPFKYAHCVCVWCVIAILIGVVEHILGMFTMLMNVLYETKLVKCYITELLTIIWC